MIFDTHAHYTSEQFAEDLDIVLADLPNSGVAGVVDCGTDYISSLKSLRLAAKYPYIYSAAGIHPECLTDEAASTIAVYKGDWQRELRDIEPLLDNPRCVAVGECGLDYHWPIPKDEQIAMFKAHLQLAQKHDMPVLIHDREAHGDMYEILWEYRPKGIVHCFSGSADDALRLVKQGLHIGFGGAVTFKNARRAIEAVQALPMESIVLETDCPYMAPVPYRGKRCTSAMISLTADKIAEIKGIAQDEVLRITEENARRLFALQ
ncbi:MAG: TatD family hydrolase [Oscillospiraceae bacterium]